ncbi:MAG TPA: hypothetical protein VGQ59_04860 [Cyclobacteriaceae bacterium]|jgi:hypothetical protein|nr:hypothetical protein [Cyclobacteriaceae bacterium]
MQVKLKFSLVLFLATSLAGLKAIAQDDGQPVQSVQEVQELNQQHPELNLNDDKTLLMDADVKASKNQNQPNTHDAGNANRNKSDGSTKPSPNDKTEEDPLSFNFIYFIIQKFKTSDIVDD